MSRLYVCALRVFKSTNQIAWIIARHIYINIYILHLPSHLRVPLTKFRVSAHTLQTEVGRYHLPHAIPEEERVCIFCGPGYVETELHFFVGMLRVCKNQ